jgi:hypothetical protein
MIRVVKHDKTLDNAGGFDTRSCPLDRLVFIDYSSESSFWVETVYEDVFYLCGTSEPVRDPADPSECNGPYRHTILNGALGGDKPQIKMSFVWHVMPSLPFAGWSSYMPSDEELKQLISDAERLDQSEMPTLGDRTFASIFFGEGAQYFTLNKASVTPEGELIPLVCR